MDGVQSSSQSGSSGVIPTRTFDVSVEAEVVQLLNFIRRGPFSPEDKNSYRDIVLDFAAEKNPSSLHILAQTLIQHGVDLTTGGLSLTTVAPATSEHTTELPTELPVDADTSHIPTPQTEVSEPIENTPTQVMPTQVSFGGSRPQPQFGASAQPSPVVEVPPVPPEPAMAVPSTPVSQNIEVNTEQSEAVTRPLEDFGVVKPLEHTPSDVSATDQISDALSTMETPSAVTETVPAPTPESVSVPVDTPEVQQSNDTPVPVKPPIERIKEIKRRVNDAVGNPVHLIDANNEIGREYMNALLNAMKQVSDGTGTDMDLAMDRLEKAYAAVMRLLVEHPIGHAQEVTQHEDTVPLQEAVTQTRSIATPVAAEETSTPKMNEPEPPAPAPQVPQVDAVPVPAPQSQEVEVPPAKIEVTDMHEVADAVQEVPLETSSQQDTVEPPAPAPVPEAPQMTNIPEKIVPIQTPAPEVAAQPQSLAAQLEAERNAQTTLAQENIAKQQAGAMSTDPLLAPEVSSGLQQLLTEWKLFKSSGFLGTGPSGFEHPLYKKMAAMQMDSIVAGRFDGATPEVRQSISDYMNGWYYEQNVAHDMNETFEHYLRRVVKRVLSKQQTGASAAGSGRA